MSGAETKPHEDTDEADRLRIAGGIVGPLALMAPMTLEAKDAAIRAIADALDFYAHKRIEAIWDATAGRVLPDPERDLQAAIAAWEAAPTDDAVRAYHGIWRETDRAGVVSDEAAAWFYCEQPAALWARIHELGLDATPSAVTEARSATRLAEVLELQPEAAGQLVAELRNALAPVHAWHPSRGTARVLAIADAIARRAGGR